MLVSNQTNIIPLAISTLSSAPTSDCSAQSVDRSAQVSSVSAQSICDSELAGELRKYLTPDALGNVTQEEYVYGAVLCCLKAYGPRAQSAFQSHFDAIVGVGEDPILALDATGVSLAQLGSDGILSQADLRQIYESALTAAGLDPSETDGSGFIRLG